MTRAATPSVQAEAETRSAVDFTSLSQPAAGGELVLDQAVGGGGVGHAQQRLGQHHERQPLLGRERIGVQEFFDAAEPAGLGADGLDQPVRARIDAGFRGSVARGLGKKARRQLFVGRRKRRSKWSAGQEQPGHRALHSAADSPNYGEAAARRIISRDRQPRYAGCGGAKRPATKASSLSMLCVQPISMPCR